VSTEGIFGSNRRIADQLAEINCELRELRRDFKLWTKPKGRLNVSICITDKKEKGNMITIDLTNLQIATITLAPKNRKGKPAPIAKDPAPTWTLQSGNCKIEPSADGTSATVTPPDEIEPDAEANTSTIVAEGDADLGAGFVALDETFVITVRTEAATTLGGAFTVADKPDAPALRAAAAAPKAAAKKTTKGKH
jgi:hypothetical protein